MKAVNGVLIYELKTCGQCQGTGRYWPLHPCPRHGKPQKGQPCPHCGSTTRDRHHYLPDQADIVCPICQGSGKEMEDRYDFMPEEILRGVPILVVRSGRAITWNESYLGLGCLCSCVDYGEHKRLTDEELAKKARENMHTIQATSVVNDQDQLPPFIAICCSDQGYSVRSAWKLPQLLREWDVETGRLVGMAVFRAGGHGTLAAALGKPPPTSPRPE